MKRIFKAVCIGLLSLIGILVIVGFFLPKQYSVTRTVVIQAPAETIFESVNNFRMWAHWSPWHNIDSTTQIQYGGPISDVGSSMSWKSENKKVGSGRQEITINEPNTYIKIALFFSGWDKPSHAIWTFKPITKNETSVTWSYQTETNNNIIYKYLSLLIMPMLGKNYEEGLQNLKKYVEKSHFLKPSFE